MPPAKDSVSLPVVFGAKTVPISALVRSKNWILVVFARSTSVNTAPKPVVNAGVVLPGMKKLTSTMLLPSAVNNRCGLKVAKRLGYVGLILPNSTGVPEAAVALT